MSNIVFKEAKKINTFSSVNIYYGFLSLGQFLCCLFC